MSVLTELSALNFHDSELKSVTLTFGEKTERSCVVEVNYYDWEGNSQRRAVDSKSEWVTRRIRITFGFVAHIEFSAPDLVNRPNALDEVQLGWGLEAFEQKYADFKRQFPRGSYPLFQDGSEVVSFRALTQNNDDERDGYIWVVGTNVRLENLAEWGRAGQIHIPIGDV